MNALEFSARLQAPVILKYVSFVFFYRLLIKKSNANQNQIKVEKNTILTLDNNFSYTLVIIKQVIICVIKNNFST